MKSGDLVQLPDGRQGYFQGKAPNGEVRILVTVVVQVPAKGVKPVRGAE